MGFSTGQSFVPKGQNENSPAFQRRVVGQFGISPVGTAEFSFNPSRQIQPVQSSLRDF